MQIGRLFGDLLTGGSTYFKRQKKARGQAREANELIASNTDLAQQMFDRDLGQSQWANVRSDPRLRAAQDTALSRLEGLSRTGFDDTDRQALDQAFMQSRGEEQAQRGAALDAAARRGDVSGGNALLGSLMAQQGGANRSAQHATDVGLAGRDRALRALEQYGSQAGQMRGQDFGEQAQRAGGIDSFTQWATGQHSQDAQFLNNARLGQSSNLQAQAAANQATPALDAGVNALANYYSGGMAGNVAGGQTTAKSDAPTGKSFAADAGATLGQPNTSGFVPAGTPSAGLAQNKSMPGAVTPASSYQARRRAAPLATTQVR